MAEGKRFDKNSKKKRIKIKSKAKLFRLLLILALIISSIILIVKLTNKKDNNPLVEGILNDNSMPQANVETERMKMLKELQKENSDIVAWIEIKDSKINYPVLQGLLYDTHIQKRIFKRWFSISRQKLWLEQT